MVDACLNISVSIWFLAREHWHPNFKLLNTNLIYHFSTRVPLENVVLKFCINPCIHVYLGDSLTIYICYAFDLTLKLYKW